MAVVLALISGSLFGIGLVLSDMIDPSRVQAFLNVASGAWDPTLMFVMGGAMTPMIIAWRIAARREKSMTGEAMPGKPAGGIDARLIAGAVLFGTGWGLVGFCPGPALASLMVGGPSVGIFVVAMLAGFAVVAYLSQRASG